MGAVGGIGLALASTGLGAFAAYRNASAANRAAEWNAQMSEAKARQARTRGEFDLSLLRVDNTRALSSLAQGFVNSGVEASSGTALNLLAEQKGMNERGEQVQRYNTEMEAWGHQANAAMARASKRSAWGAGFSSLLGGFTSVYNQYGQYRMLTGASSSCSRNSCYL